MGCSKVHRILNCPVDNAQKINRVIHWRLVYRALEQLGPNKLGNKISYNVDSHRPLVVIQSLWNGEQL